MLEHMRTTLNLDDELMKRARQLAATRGVTLTEIFETALRDLVSARSADYELDLPVVEGRRPPAADLSDRSALIEHMDGRR
ncbi:hypothetical protein BH23ACT5_BH23ACT5_05040 [soil metagenome]